LLSMELPGDWKTLRSLKYRKHKAVRQGIGAGAFE
jgi:hypothetical protein